MTIRTFADIRVLIETGDLSDAEQTLIRNCKSGEETILGDGERPSGPSLDRTIRADLLRYLILGGCNRCQIHELGVRLAGAWISGRLDLSFAAAKGATGFINCGFEQKIEALQTRFEALNLTGSVLPGLNAQGIRATGDVFLRGVNSKGEVSLSGADIGGELGCQGAELDGAGEYALLVQGVRVTGDVFLRRLKSTGEVHLSGAAVGGQLDCEGAQLDGIGGGALNAQGIQVKQGVFIPGVKSKGEVRLAGAEIGGQLDCEGAQLDGIDGDALNAQGVRLTGNAKLERLRSTGEVSLSGAEIGGQLDCQGAELDGGSGMALNAQGLRVIDSVFLRRLKSTGEVSLSGAEVGGQLNCRDAELDGGDGVALNAQRLVVKKSFFWRRVKSVKGVVDLTAAHLSDLVDDADSWDKVPGLLLSGLTYANLAGPLDVEMRKAWLKKGAKSNGNFHPQPYQHLAKFFRETGHRREARDILIEKEIQQRRAARERWSDERYFRSELRQFVHNESDGAAKKVAARAAKALELSETWVELFGQRFRNTEFAKSRDPMVAQFLQQDFRNQLL
ncbi:hypothetical protein [uncultured Roseibium sp.]|uniref:hypothetical protein n=1 Tax=uncultured Roseibium sp. TaxID=1936171 RepID=UPI002598B20A|nr:hypothetical protein [uncultured Roseibium sp.]